MILKILKIAFFYSVKCSCSGECKRDTERTFNERARNHEGEFDRNPKTAKHFSESDAMYWKDPITILGNRSL